MWPALLLLSRCPVEGLLPAACEPGQQRSVNWQEGPWGCRGSSPYAALPAKLVL